MVIQKQARKVFLLTGLSISSERVAAKYGDGAPDKANPFDLQSGYLRHILSFIGLTSVEIIAANGMDMGDKPQAEGLASARTKIDTIVKAKVTELTA